MLRRSLAALSPLFFVLACGSSSTAVEPEQIDDGTGGAGASGSAGQSAGKGGTSTTGGSSGGGQAQAGTAGQPSGGKSGAAGTAGATGGTAGGGGSSAGASGTAGASGMATAGSSGAGGDPNKECPLPPKCDAAPPDPGSKSSWNDFLSNGISLLGAAHRGRDLFLNPGDPQWVIGKFAYGAPVDKDLKGEDVDIYLLRGCEGSWEKLGTTKTTKDNAHPTKEHVDDTGGRVFFPIPSDKALGLGRHRLHMVVKGDLSTTDVFIEVVPKGQPMFVSDVDGTLTITETEEYKALLSGNVSPAHPDAAKVFTILAKKGYRPMYLTARPEYLISRTREFVDVQGFPAGIVHTTLGLTGALGGAASTFKTDELAWIGEHGLSPAWAFGNTATDALAYDNAKILPKNQRIMFQFDDTVSGARRIETYSTLLQEVSALPAVCP